MLWLCQYIMNWMINIYLVWPHTHTQKPTYYKKRHPVFFSFPIYTPLMMEYNVFISGYSFMFSTTERKMKLLFIYFILIPSSFFLFISGHPYKVSIYIIVLSNDRLVWNGIWITMQKKNESLNERMKNLTMDNTFYIRRLNSW